ncbi:MAG: rnfB [Burkholderiaceae bacterium]|jgi:electron transport complex protein RnfB|nr:rnfB [Burkholderiaceae bacterium]
MMQFFAALADRIDAVLPQTQCTKCGFSGCRPYAEAIAAGTAGINQCPPGGAIGIDRLAAVTGRPPLPLNPSHGVERPLHVAVIDESLCIGCTLCIQACPVDAIVGAARVMHTVVAEWCNGCDLCVAPCPMDCIAMVPVLPVRAWNDDDARWSRARYEARGKRLAVERAEREQSLLLKAQSKLVELSGRDDLAPEESARKRAVVQAAIERARARRQPTAKP